MTHLQMDSLNLIPRHYLPYHQNGVEDKNEHSICFNVHMWTNGVSLNKKLGALIYDDGGNMVPWNLKCKLVSLLSWTLHNKRGKIKFLKKLFKSLTFKKMHTKYA